MYPPSPPGPPAPRRPAARPAQYVDPLAVVIGNASLLGIGYLFLRRRGLATAALATSLFFALVLAADPDGWFWRILLTLWWIATILHSWHITRVTVERPLLDLDDPSPARRPRFLAVGVTGLVLLVFLGLRLDATWTVQSAMRDHADGDCEQAIASLTELGAPHRIAYGSMAAAGESELTACRLVMTALRERPAAGARTLQTYLDHPSARWDGAGPLRAELLLRAARVAGDEVEGLLKAGFAQLSTALRETPGQSDRVEQVVTGFVSDLADDTDACKANRINDWVYERDWAAKQVADPVADGADNVPVQLLACARDQFAADRYEPSRKLYQRFLDEFADHESAEAAADELYEVESTIERLEVTDLFENEQYCGSPAPYRGADSAKGKGPHRMKMFGLDPADYGFPKSWKGTDVDDTALAVCVEGPDRGSFQQSCYYESKIGFGGVRQVKFYASKFKVKAYAIKTGKRVAKYTAQIGDPCPRVLKYKSYGVDIGPPGEVESEYSDADVRGIFKRLVD